MKIYVIPFITALSLGAVSGLVSPGLHLSDSLRWALVVLVFGGLFFAVGVGVLLGRRAAPE